MGAFSVTDYYHILGVSENASLEDIKKAYRAKAKILHPDKNKSIDAHTNFILLNEAYEYLLNLKTGDHPDNTEEWENTQREAASGRAEEYAKMKYNDFLRSDQYKSVLSFSVIVYHLGFLIALGILFVLPIVASMIYGVTGFWVSVLVNFVMSPITVNAIRDSPPLNLGAFMDAVLFILNTKGFLLTFLTITNIIVILKIALQTLFPTFWLLSIIFYSIVIVFAIKWFRKDRNKFRLFFHSFCIVPMVINSLILINFIFSSNPVKETYNFQNDTQNVSSGRGYGSRQQQSTYIFLDNNTYEDYPGIRVFIDYDAMKFKKQITYTFKEGLLGYRVMTAYEFNP